MGARAICISHELAAGGPEVGRLVAGRLGYRYLDEEIIAAASARAGVDPERIADAEQRRSLARKLVEDHLAWAGTIAVTHPLAPSRLEDESFRKLIVEVVRAAAAEGHAVIVAHAASLAVRGRPDVLRVSITAPHDVRARRVAEETGADEAGAAAAVRKDDKARAAYLRSFYQVGREEPTHYDVVLNTEALTVAQAAALVEAAAACVDAAAAPTESSR
jgi:cytidylate kinase